MENSILNYIQGFTKSDEDPVPTWACYKPSMSSSDLPVMYVASIPCLPDTVTEFCSSVNLKHCITSNVF